MKYTYTEKKDTRSGFGDGLAELADKNPNVVALCADLIGSLKMEKFIEKAPERFYQIGIAEANMIGIAAGLSINGKIPFTGTFANFSTARVYDQNTTIRSLLRKKCENMCLPRRAHIRRRWSHTPNFGRYRYDENAT